MKSTVSPSTEIIANPTTEAKSTSKRQSAGPSTENVPKSTPDITPSMKKLLARFVVNSTDDGPTPMSAPSIRIEVDSTSDGVDAIPGDGRCDDGAGNCTLRAAIMEANATAKHVAIDLPAGTYIISIPSSKNSAYDSPKIGDLDIAGQLTIVGAGADITIIDGVGVGIFEISEGSNVSISGVTIQNGYRGILTADSG